MWEVATFKSTKDLLCGNKMCFIKLIIDGSVRNKLNCTNNSEFNICEITTQHNRKTLLYNHTFVSSCYDLAAVWTKNILDGMWTVCELKQNSRRIQTNYALVFCLFASTFSFSQLSFYDQWGANTLSRDIHSSAEIRLRRCFGAETGRQCVMFLSI